MSFAKRRLFVVVTRPNIRYPPALRPNEHYNKSIATMANKASLKPAEDFIEFVNVSPTRTPLRMASHEETTDTIK
jgi:hypothetical protein